MIGRIEEEKPSPRSYYAYYAAISGSLREPKED